MKELKRAEMIHNEEFDIRVKPYISIAEMELIVGKVILVDNVVQREILKDMLVLSLCTNIEDVDDMDYDLVVESGLLKTVKSIVKNYNEIEDYVSKSEAINRSVMKFLESISNTADKAIDRMPKNNKAWEKLIGQLGDVVKRNDK